MFGNSDKVYLILEFNQCKVIICTIMYIYIICSTVYLGILKKKKKKKKKKSVVLPAEVNRNQEIIF